MAHIKLSKMVVTKAGLNNHVNGWLDHLLLAIFKPAALVVISDRDIDINTSEQHSLLVDFFSLLSTVTHYVLQNAYCDEKDKEKMMLPMTRLLFF